MGNVHNVFDDGTFNVRTLRVAGKCALCMLRDTKNVDIGDRGRNMNAARRAADHH